MTADTPSSIPEKPASQPGLRIALVLLSGYHFLNALSEVWMIFGQHPHTDAFEVFAQCLSQLRHGLSPVIAGAALFFAIRHNVPHAIVALATYLLLTWVSEIPSLMMQGIWPKADFLSVAFVVLYPLFAFAAMWLALRNERLVTATVLAAIPMFAKYAFFAVLLITEAISRSF